MTPTSAKHLRKPAKNLHMGRQATYTPGVQYSTLHFDRTNHEEIRPDMIRPEDGPNMGLPSVSTMQKLVDRGLVKAEFSAQGKHGGGYFKTIIIGHNEKFGGWKRTGS